MADDKNLKNIEKSLEEIQKDTSKPASDTRNVRENVSEIEKTLQNVSKKTKDSVDGINRIASNTKNSGAIEKGVIQVVSKLDAIRKLTCDWAKNSDRNKGNGKGVVGNIDDDAKTVVLDFPAGTDVSHLVPVIKVSRYATVMPESGVAQDFTQPVLYTVTSFNGDSVQYMVSAVVHDAENEKSILSFRVEDPVCEGVINEVAKTVTLTFPEGTEVSQLVPIIEVSEGATVVPASGEAQDFTHPVEYTVTAMNGTTAVYTVTAVVEENPVGPTGKTVLLNDYTGVRCNNCPAAAELAHSLQEQYGERLIVMSIHAGSLSVPAGSLPDFRTEEGTEWYNNNTSNPIGSVDRVKLLSGYTLPVTQWENAVDAAFGETQTVELKVNNSYNETSRMLTTTIDAQALETLSGELALTVCFVEDSIVGMQVTPSGMQNDYLHRHVFRGTWNGA